ncbi:MAG: Gfo/Idh/MocA family oxidoreductase [Sedimentisphaerales bacterium]|nr:Gfo/Idh/MocA family oxidoreductase [Sedimentisphaerales bacterium]
MDKVSWGILSTAKIGTEKVIPAMQKGKFCEIRAIASRDLGKAQKAAAQLKIPIAYGSYEELLADDEIKAIYNPLPNHMHVDWSVRSLRAGKHVLCEKPIGINAAEAQELLKVVQDYPDLKVMEAFMYRHHPQWIKTKQLVTEGGIGELRTIQSLFSFFKNDPENIRNKPQFGGGSILDIGCYCISLSRFIFGFEPSRIIGFVEYDPQLKIDRLASGILDFDGRNATFTCSMQLNAYQRVNIFGTQGWIEIEIPFNAPSNKPCKLWHTKDYVMKEIVFDTCDQYKIQGDLFSQAILNKTNVPTPLQDAVDNMKVIDAFFESAKKRTWHNLK